MIHRIESSLDSFKSAELKPHFNVVLAERTQDATLTDTRNALGKSSLIEVIHYCLGSSVNANTSVRAKELEGTDFSLSLDLKRTHIKVTRKVDEPGSVELSGDITQLPMESDLPLTGPISISNKAWTALLGKVFFEIEERRELEPSFRSLIA